MSKSAGREVARSGHDHGRGRRRRETHVPAPTGVRLRRGAMDTPGRPGSRPAGPDGAGPDEHCIRRGAKQTHHEPIGLEPAADLAAAACAHAIERDDAIQRRDEVHDDRRPIATKLDLERGIESCAEMCRQHAAADGVSRVAWVGHPKGARSATTASRRARVATSRRPRGPFRSPVASGALNVTSAHRCAPDPRHREELRAQGRSAT